MSKPLTFDEFISWYPETSEYRYESDVIILDRIALESEPRWKKESIITLGTTVRIAVEVVSTNWRDDYGYKLVDYEALSIR